VIVSLYDMVKNNIYRIFSIIILFIISYVLVNFYRPFKASNTFNDFGIADSGSGMISLIIVYLAVSKTKSTYTESKNLAIVIFLLYFTQEVLSYFFKSIGTYDFKDIVYYVLGFIIIYYFDVKGRKNIRT
jgi:Na+/H+ antiporter NhaC